MLVCILRGVAQLGLERGVRDAEVAGSNPVAPTKIITVYISVYVVSVLCRVSPFYPSGVHKVSILRRKPLYQSIY